MSSKVIKNATVAHAADADIDAERRMFSAARKLKGNTRADYLVRSCGDNEALLRRIEKLLAATELDSGLLDRDFKSVYFELSDSGLSKLGNTSSMVDEVLALFEPVADDENIFGRVAHYQIRAMIGRGAFGVVFKAFDEKLARLVAIKVLSPSLARIPEYRERFLKEARAVASIRHDNVVRIHAVEESPFPFIVMELIDGETLQSHIRGTGPLPTKEITELSIQVVQGLAAAHKQGLVHLDVKPSNILLERISDGKTRARLTDFGLALFTDDAGQVVPEAVFGTPAYMSPEQARGEKIDQRADLFSFGSVIFAMCSGQAAFAGEETVSVIRGVVETDRTKLPDGVRISKGFSRIINRLHLTLPEDRYRSADEVLKDLQRLSCKPVGRSVLWKYVGVATVVAALSFAGFSLLLPGNDASAEKATWSRARQQLVNVTDELEKLDERFVTDQCMYEIEDGKLTFLRLPFAHNLSALSSLKDVEHLCLEPPGPLREVPVDLSFLDGMKKLRNLELLSFPAKSLEPLRGHQLQRLHLWYSRINAQEYPADVDLGPLEGMPLNWLNIGGCGIESLQPLAGMKLEFLCMSQSTPVSDLSPVAGMPLHTLLIRDTNVCDLSPLIGSELKILEISGSKVRDLSPLTHLSLEELKIHSLKIDDMAILKKCNVKALWMDYDASHEELVKSIPGLERLNGQTLADFLETADTAN